MSNQAGGRRRSGWEVADGAARGAGRAFRGIGLVILKCYALLLIVAGIVLVVKNPGDNSWWGGLLASAYGLYLLLPGSKWVVW